jgi:hypothetical protein
MAVPAKVDIRRYNKGLGAQTPSSALVVPKSFFAHAIA